MSTISSEVFTAAILLLTLISTLHALDIESAKERPCMEVTKTASLDLNWVTSQKTWYYPLMSRLDLYLLSSAVAGKDPKDLTEDELYYDSCMRFEVEGAGYTGYGFNGKKNSFNIKPIPGTNAHEEYSDDGKLMATCYTTLTDNKTFVFATCCSVDNQQTWGVNTPLKKLPEETLKLTKEHAKSLGFKSEFFTGIRYDHCDDKQKRKTEL